MNEPDKSKPEAEPDGPVRVRCYGSGQVIAFPPCFGTSRQKGVYTTILSDSGGDRNAAGDVIPMRAIGFFADRLRKAGFRVEVSE